MPIKIEFSADTPLKAMALMAAFGMRCQCDDDVFAVASRICEEEAAREQAAPNEPAHAHAPEPKAQPVAPSVTPVAPVSAPPAAAPAPVAPVSAPTAAAPAPAVPVSAAPGYTTEQVAKAGSDLIAAHPEKMQALWDLLGQYGVNAVTNLTPEQLGPFATALRGMGANL